MIHLLFLAFRVFALDIYYVSSSTGSDNSDCGTSIDTPCASINQILVNFPGVSIVVSVDTGAYPTTAFSLQRDAVVSLEGTKNSNVICILNTGNFISNNATTGFAFSNFSLTLVGAGNSFTTLLTADNTASFSNILLTYDDEGFAAVFVDLRGGVLVVTNLTLVGASINYFFIHGISDGDETNITMTGCSFVNIDIAQNGSIVFFDSILNSQKRAVATESDVGVGIDSTVFANITAKYALLDFTNQAVYITNVLFNGTATYLAALFFRNLTYIPAVMSVWNGTWTNCSARYDCGGLEIRGPQLIADRIIALDHLSFVACSGPNSGAVYIINSPVNVSNCHFAGNTGRYAADMLLGISESVPLYKVNDSCSASELPRAVIRDIYTNDLTDISDLLPDCSSDLDGIIPFDFINVEQ